MNNTKIARVRILNEKGLHARAAAKFVELVDKFDVKAVSYTHLTLPTTR